MPKRNRQQNLRLRRETSSAKAAKVNKEEDVILGDTEQKDPEELALESLVFGLDADSFLDNLGLKDDQEPPLLETNSAGESLSHDPSSESGGQKKRKPAWEDDDDADEQISSVKVEKDRRYKQLRRNDETKISSQTYKSRLKQRFEKIAGDGSWARLDREKRRARKDSASGSDSDDELLRSTGDHLASSASLVKGTINFKQCSDINKEKPSKTRLRSVEFHPSAQVALASGVDQTLNLFQVDGRHNPLIQSVYLDKFPILTAHFSRDGREVLMGSKHKSFSYYDMIAGKVHNVPHIKGLSSRTNDRMGYFEMSPDGEIIAFRGRDGLIYLVSAKSKEWISTLKMNGSCDALTFNSDGSRMFSFGQDGDVYVWDMTSRECVHRFWDDGCLKGTALACSRNSQYIATGSSSGVVNVYDYESCMSSDRPKPLKALTNLTTSCSQVRFNHNSEMLAMGSDCAEKALKLVHLPSLTVFSNFPERTDCMRIPVVCDFSLNSGYLAVGAHCGRALLYRLKHYGSY